MMPLVNEKINEQNSTQMLLSEHGAFLTVSDLKKILKVSRYVVDRMLKTGQFPSAKLGGQYRVRTDDFIKWWDNRVKNEQKNLLISCLPTTAGTVTLKKKHNRD